MGEACADSVGWPHALRINLKDLDLSVSAIHRKVDSSDAGTEYLGLPGSSDIGSGLYTGIKSSSRQRTRKTLK